jgi:hypothetical protein
VAWDGYEEDPSQGLEMVRLFNCAGFGLPGDAIQFTLQEGDSAAVVCHSTGSTGWVLPQGWDEVERYVSPSGYLYVVASITNAPAGSHSFASTPVAESASWRKHCVAGYALRGGNVGGRWSHIRGPERNNNRSFSFQTPDPGWAIGWQESSCTSVYGLGLEDVPYTPPGLLGFAQREGGSSVLWSYEFPRGGSPADQFASGSWFQPPKTSDTYGPGSNLYAFNSIGAYGIASSVAWALGWNP